MSDVKYIAGRTSWDRRVSSILSPKAKYFQADEILRESFYIHKWKNKKRKLFKIHTTMSSAPYKGFETVCEAMYELKKIKDDIFWQVAGISEGDPIVKAVRKKLKNRYPKKGLILLGKLTQDDLIKNILDSDIYIMPSHIENSPNSLCEAMLLGMPCIATYAGGTGSLLQDGKEGILIQDGDPWAMAGAVLELYNNKEIAKKYAENSRNRTLIRHDKSRIVEDLISVYKSIIESNG